MPHKESERRNVVVESTRGVIAAHRIWRSLFLLKFYQIAKLLAVVSRTNFFLLSNLFQNKDCSGEIREVLGRYDIFSFTIRKKSKADQY